MLIQSEGRPAVLVPIIVSDSDKVLWVHCFEHQPILDNKLNRVMVRAMLLAHGMCADFTHKLKKRNS